MSENQRFPPRFKAGSFVYLTAPLDQHTIPTWVAEGEINHNRIASSSPSSAESVIIKTEEGIDEESSSITALDDDPGCIEPSIEVSPTQLNHKVTRSNKPLSMIIAEKTVSLLPLLPDQVNIIRHTPAWIIENVIPAVAADQSHKYCLTPVDPIKVYVSESVMEEANVFIGTIVKKRDGSPGFWVVAGLSVSEGVIMADIYNKDGDIGVVPADSLRMLPADEALEAMVED